MNLIYVILSLLIIPSLFFTGILCIAASDADNMAEIQYQR